MPQGMTPPAKQCSRPTIGKGFAKNGNGEKMVLLDAWAAAASHCTEPTGYVCRRLGLGIAELLIGLVVLYPCMTQDTILAAAPPQAAAVLFG